MIILLSNIYLLSLLTIEGKTIYGFKDNKPILTAVKFIIAVMAISYINSIKVLGNAPIFIFILLVIYAIAQFKADKWYNKFLYIVYCEIIIALCETIVIFIFNNMLQVSLQHEQQSLQYFYALCTSNVLATIIIIKFRKYYKQIFYHDKSLPYFVVFIFPIATISFIFGINNYFLAVKNSSIIITLIFLFLSNLASLFLIIKYVESVEIKHQLEIQKYKETYNNAKFEMMNNHYNDTFSLLHDVLNRCDTINQKLNKKNYDEITKEFNDLVSVIFKQFNLIHTNSLALSYVINNNLDKIKSNDIDIETTIEEGNISFIKFSDQIDLFNCLINAIIAEDNKNCHLYLKLKYVNNVLVLNAMYDSIFDPINKIIDPLKDLIRDYDISYKIIDKNNMINIIFVFNKA